MLTPIALAQALLPGMAERKFGRIVNITSGSVRAPIAGLDVSSGARAGLTAFLASAARAHVRDNVTINSIQPGVVRHRPDTVVRSSAPRRSAAISLEAARAEAQARNPGPSLRRSGRVRRALRVSRERPRRLHHRAEHPDRRRRVSGRVLSKAPGRRCAAARPVSPSMLKGIALKIGATFAFALMSALIKIGGAGLSRSPRSCSSARSSRWSTLAAWLAWRGEFPAALRTTPARSAMSGGRSRAPAACSPISSRCRCCRSPTRPPSPSRRR